MIHMERLARECEERADETPPQTVRELLARQDERSAFVLEALGRVAAELARLGKRLEDKADRHELAPVRQELESVSTEIEDARKEELARLRSDHRDWIRWAVRGAVVAVVAAVGSVIGYFAGGRHP